MENKNFLISAQNREDTQRWEETPKSLTLPTAKVEGVGTPFFLQPVNSSPNRQVMTTLRITLRLAALFLLLAPLAALQAVDDGPIVGAIRWDGWYGEGTVTKAVEASLGQPDYHLRGFDNPKSDVADLDQIFRVDIVCLLWPSGRACHPNRSPEFAK